MSDVNAPRPRERGVAAVIAVVAVALMSLLGMSLVLNTRSEMAVAANFRNAQEGLYAVDAVLERAIIDLAETADWTPVLDGTLRSTFVDGAPSGTRSLVGGASVDLVRVVNVANCDKSTPCSPGDLVARTATRPWGVNNSVWVLYAYGPVERLVPGGTINSPYYVLAMVADDGGEADGDPGRDSAPGSPGSGMVRVRGESYGPGGTRKVVEAAIARSHPGRVRLVSWREVR